jgi:hypothetical protein
MKSLEEEPMPDDVQKALDALIAKLGPVAVLEAVSGACAARASAPGEEPPELWECAAEAARGAAAQLRGEDDEELEDEGQLEDDDDEDLDQEQEGEDDAPTNEAAGADGAEHADAPSPERRSAPAAPDVKEMTTVRSIGQRPADVTHWRCRRVPQGSRSGGTLLTWGDRAAGLEFNEWVIKTLSIKAIADRWGPGWYVVEYYRIAPDGARTPRGRSRPLHIVGSEPAAPEAAPPPPAAPQPLPVAPGSLDMSTIFTFMAMIDERAEKARVSERAAMQMQLERERLASQERIAQIQAMFRATGRGPAVDPDAIVARVTDAVTERVSERISAELDERLPEDGGEAPQVAQGDQTAANYAAIVKEIRETLAPLVTVLATKLTTSNGAPALTG